MDGYLFMWMGVLPERIHAQSACVMPAESSIKGSVPGTDASPQENILSHRPALQEFNTERKCTPTAVRDACQPPFGAGSRIQIPQKCSQCLTHGAILYPSFLQSSGSFCIAFLLDVRSYYRLCPDTVSKKRLFIATVSEIHLQGES